MINKYGGYYDENDNFIIDDNHSMDEDSDPDYVPEVDLDYSSEEDIEEMDIEELEVVGKPNKPKKPTKKEDLKELDLTTEEYEMMTEDELKYWKKLSPEERSKIKELEKELEKYDEEDEPERFKLLKFPVSLAIKRNIMQKLTQIEMMEPSDPEYFKLNKWIEGVMDIPFGKYIDLPVSKKDSQKKIYEFLSNVSENMDNSTYGHQEAKDKIMQVVCQWISNPQSMGNIIALQGPPGIGKTSLVRNGISKALGRPFHMIALGGATDSTFLEGHSYTYEGSNWGRITNILMDSKVMNPVIFFDELDKISATKHGEEITGVLTHLTDLTQNAAFNDKYFSGIDLDLSRCLFVFSYNDESAINPILKDRLIRINLKGFKTEEKILIAQNYLLKELFDNIGLDSKEVIFPDEIVKKIIEEYTEEEGVRSLRRCLETILLKLNMAKYTNYTKGKPLAIGNELQNIKFPVVVDEKLLGLLLKKKEDEDDSNSISKRMMYI
jgi:ATP-dependent Lon protease